MQRRQLIQAAGALPVLSFATLAARTAFAFDGPELYAGEKALYAEAQKEGLCVSFDTGPEWANWKSLFRDFKKRYPEIELTYNDIGSAATVVALEKTKRRPQADTAYYFAASAVDAAKKDVVAPFKPINFDKLPPVFREAEGRWFTIHTLNIAFLVNKKLVKNVPTGWADLLKPEFKNTVVYLDPRSTGIGQVLTFAAAYANGGSVDNVQPGTDYLDEPFLGAAIDGRFASYYLLFVVALVLVLAMLRIVNSPFGRVLVWALGRPTTRVLRAIRAARGAAFKAAGRVKYPEKKITPSWAKEAARKARELGRSVRQSCMSLGLVFTKDTSNCNPFKARLVDMEMVRWSEM